MAQAVKDNFLDLERHRQLLEENVEKLRKSLQHWQMWEAEYEGLKEEIVAIEGTPSREQLITISKGYEGTLVTKKEAAEILGLESSRSVAQVVNILDRRIDYVHQNVRSIQKQVDAAETKLAASAIVSNPEVMNEDGLPFTEIIEELDENGNITSSRLSTPGNARTQLLEVLEKAGIKELPNSEQTSAAASADEGKSVEKKEITPSVTSKDVAVSRKKGSTQPPIANRPTKKGVKFTEDTKVGPAQQKSQTAKRIEDIMKLAKQGEKATSESPVIPTDETPEDAALRREMLQYGMSEVGAVVAELDLENGSDWSDGGYDDLDSSTDDEDEYGRTTKRVVDDDIRREMIALEERLGVRMMENIGNKATDYDVVQEGIGRVTISGRADSSQEPVDRKGSLAFPDETQLPADNLGTAASPAIKPSKKSVKFAEELDIATYDQPAAPTPPTTIRGTAPVSNIIERTTPTQATEPVPSKKASRFKASRGIPPTTAPPASQTPNIINGPLATLQSGPSLRLFPAASQSPKPFSTPLTFSPSMTDNPRTVPSGPENEILASTIVERDSSSSLTDSAGAIREPDELDPQLLNQEVAIEYHKMRNRMIQRQGGFGKEDDGEVVPFSEEEGGPRKMSRFKAARLGKS